MAELRDRERHESTFARRLSRLGGKHRRELAALLGNPPDPNRVPPEFWNRVQRETEQEIAAVMLLIFIASAEQHGMEADRASGFASAFAATEARTFADRFVENSARSMLRGTVAGRAPGEIADRVFSDARFAAIARTETTRTRSAAIRQSARDGGTDTIADDGSRIPRDQSPVLVWELEVVRTVQQHCTFCPMMAGTGEDFWGRFVSGGPPAHVFCACGIRVLPAGTQTFTALPPDSLVLSAADDSGVEVSYIGEPLSVAGR